MSSTRSGGLAERPARWRSLYDFMVPSVGRLTSQRSILWTTHRMPRMPGGEGGKAKGRLSCSRVISLWWLKDPMVLSMCKESWSIFLLLLRGGCPDTGILRSRPRILGYCERFPCEIWRSDDTSILRVGTADTSILVLTHPVSITVLDPRRRSIPVSQS